jgi:dienelactone hydrolase
MEAVSHLNDDQVTADLNAAAEYANKLPASNGKLFVGGFCWGGRWANLSFRDESPRSERGLCLLWSASRQSCDGPNHSVGVRFLCRQ